MPGITQAQGYVVDAMNTVDQVESLLAGLPLTPEQQTRAKQAIKAARVSLKAAQLSVNTAAGALGACSELDPFAALAEFVKVWPLIESLLGEVMQGASGSAVVGVAPPMVVMESRSRGIAN